jgi:hypothetical protein
MIAFLASLAFLLKKRIFLGFVGEKVRKSLKTPSNSHNSNYNVREIRASVCYIINAMSDER